MEWRPLSSEAVVAAAEGVRLVGFRLEMEVRSRFSHVQNMRCESKESKVTARFSA